MGGAVAVALVIGYLGGWFMSLGGSGWLRVGIRRRSTRRIDVVPALPRPAPAGADTRIRGRYRQSQTFLATECDEREASFSPDGSHIVYVSNETGRHEVYVRPYPGPGGKLSISTEGGNQPVWARDGQTIFYRSGDSMMSVGITLAPRLSAATPEVLFEARFEEGYTYHPRVNDVADEGVGFVLAKGDEALSPDRLEVVVNWFDELRRLMSSGEAP